jgi:hypothetical protein
LLTLPHPAAALAAHLRANRPLDFAATRYTSSVAQLAHLKATSLNRTPHSWGNQSKSKSGPGSNVMGLGHEKLDGYRLSIGSVAWVYEKADGLTSNHRSARDQWLRASQSIPLNTEPNRRKSIPIPVPISISKRRSPNKAVEATEYRRFTADAG